MNITNDNYMEEYPKFLEHLRRCTFIAVDQEMTGVDAPAPDVPSPSDEEEVEIASEDEDMDLGVNVQQPPKPSRKTPHWPDLDASPEEVYQAKRRTSTMYMAFQFGITLFTAAKDEPPVGEAGLGLVPPRSLPSDWNEPAANMQRLEEAFRTPLGSSPTGEWVVRPYNFFLKPTDGNIALSASAMHFLASNDCDFQKWLTKGMPFFTARGEATLRAEFRAAWQRRADPSVCLLPSSVRGEKIQEPDVPSTLSPWVEEVNGHLRLAGLHLMEKARQQLQKEPQDDTAVVPVLEIPLLCQRRMKHSNKKLLETLYGSHPSFRIALMDPEGDGNRNDKRDKNKEENKGAEETHGPAGSAALLRIQPLPALWAIMRKVLEKAQHEAHTADTERLWQAVEEDLRHVQQKESSEEFRRKLGFRPFWKAILRAKKPMVGHNFLHDLMFMVRMHERRLPPTYQGFKSLVSKLFPGGIWDSKVLATVLYGVATPFGRTNLERVFHNCLAEVQKACEAENDAEKKKKEVEEGCEPTSTPTGGMIGIRFAEGFRNYDIAKGGATTAEKFHEGAFDALITGYAFHWLGGSTSTDWMESRLMGRRLAQRKEKKDSLLLLQMYKNKLCAFKSAFITNLATPSGASLASCAVAAHRHESDDTSVDTSVSSSSSDAAAQESDELVHCFAFFIETRELMSYDDVKDALVYILRKGGRLFEKKKGEKNEEQQQRGGKTNERGAGSSVFVLSLHTNRFGCTTTFYVTCISEEVKRLVMQGIRDAKKLIGSMPEGKTEPQKSDALSYLIGAKVINCVV